MLLPSCLPRYAELLGEPFRRAMLSAYPNYSARLQDVSSSRIAHLELESQATTSDPRRLLAYPTIGPQ